MQPNNIMSSAIAPPESNKGSIFSSLKVSRPTMENIGWTVFIIGALQGAQYVFDKWREANW